jgi:hypothetical protein
MADVNVIKLKVRRGTDVQRKLIVLDQGEIGYTVDSKRLFVGDGTTTGGVSTGSKLYFGTITSAVVGDGNISTAQTGDIVIDAPSVYLLSGSSTFFNKTSAYVKLK